MKKLLSVLLCTATILGSVFADNFFTNRIFELKVNVPFNLSNNTFAIADFMVKDLVIDLNDLSKKMPNSGFKLVTSTNPTVDLNLRVPFTKVSAGVSVGADVYGQIGLSKTLFDFICNGNENFLSGDNKLDVTSTVRGDVFSYVEAKGAFNVGKFGFVVKPTYFIPVAHAHSDGVGVSLENDEDGNVKVDAYGDVNVYTICDVNDMSSVTQYIAKSAGFDIAGIVNYDLFRFLKVSTAFRIPIVPGHLNYHNVYAVSGHYETSLTSLLEGTESEDNKPFKYTPGEWEQTKYAINRPLKLNAYADFDLLPNFLILKGGLGFGIRNPFTQEAMFYPEYYAGGTISLLNILSVTASTEYTNTLFIHQIAATANIRVLQIDLGVSTQSASFTSSFRLAGVGAFINCTVGF